MTAPDLRRYGDLPRTASAASARHRHVPRPAWPVQVTMRRRNRTTDGCRPSIHARRLYERRGAGAGHGPHGLGAGAVQPGRPANIRTIAQWPTRPATRYRRAAGRGPWCRRSVIWVGIRTLVGPDRASVVRQCGFRDLSECGRSCVDTSGRPGQRPRLEPVPPGTHARRVRPGQLHPSSGSPTLASVKRQPNAARPLLAFTGAGKCWFHGGAEAVCDCIPFDQVP